MLRSIKEITEYNLLAIDGNLSGVSGFLFDDLIWLIRYLITEVPMEGTGNMKKILIAPFSFGIPNSEHREFPIILSKQKIQESPLVDLESPITRKQQLELYKYYGWPPYGKNILNGIQPDLLINDSKRRKGIFNSHLLNTGKTIGYHIIATDVEIGEIYDFIIDDELWIIRYISADIGEQKADKKVLIFPELIKEISQDNKKIVIRTDKNKIRNSPEYISSLPIEREYEIRLHQHYGFLRYWD
jgi:hypothetical protein